MSDTNLRAYSHPIPSLGHTLAIATLVQIICTANVLALTAMASTVAGDLGIDAYWIGYQVSAIYAAGMFSSAIAGTLVGRYGASRIAHRASSACLLGNRISRPRLGQHCRHHRRDPVDRHRLWSRATSIGWNGVLLAEIARSAPQGKVGAFTGAVLVYTFVGVIVGPSGFAILYAVTGDYGISILALSLAGFAGTILSFAVHRQSLQLSALA